MTERGAYRIFETTGFRRDLKETSQEVGQRLAAKIAAVVYPALRREPHVGPAIRKLRGWRPETWRYRVGRWRLFYEIDEKQRIVFVTALDERKDAYR